MIPAFAGLSSPHWDPHARGTILGLTRGAKKEHLVRATLESIAYRCRDIMVAMIEDTEIKVRLIKADGGASQNDFILQFMADMLHVDVERPKILEATALGAAYFAGLRVGYWKSQDELKKYRKVDKKFSPKMGAKKREELYKEWERAVERALDWA
jgi:glycerol kinase